MDKKLKVSLKPQAKPQQPLEPETESKPKRITFEVSESRHDEIRLLALKKKMTIKELMLDLIDRELENWM